MILGKSLTFILYTTLRKSIRVEGNWGSEELEMGVVVNAFNSITLIRDGVRWISTSLKTARPMKGVQGQPRLCR